MAERKDDDMEMSRAVGRGIIEVHTGPNETATGDRDQQEISTLIPGATSTPATARSSLMTEIRLNVVEVERGCSVVEEGLGCWKRFWVGGLCCWVGLKSAILGI